MSWWRSVFSRRPAGAQWDAELQFHVEKLVEEHLAAGLSPAEARRRALLEFGGTQQVKEDLREVHRWLLWDHAISNLRYALRQVRRSPGFAATVVLTLALGIGANSAVFSAIDTILLQPLPFPQSDQLMQMGQHSRQVRDPVGPVAPVRLQEWQRLNATFQAITGYYTESVSETSGALPEKLTRAWVAPRFLQVWGVAPAMGRDFFQAEERFGGPCATLISDRLWRRKFNADPQVLGKRLRFGRIGCIVVGVMPPSFLFPGAEADLWSATPMDAPYAQSREATWFITVGRLKPGVTVAQARSDMATVQSNLGRQYAKTDAELTVYVVPLKQTIIGESHRSLWLLFGSVSLLLLIACTNISALMLSRAAHRQQEVAVRLSLGASRAAVIAQLFTESLVLALAGGALGLLVAAGAMQIFRQADAGFPRAAEIGVNGRLLLYTLLCALLTTLLCGLAPVWQSMRRNLSAAVGQGGRAQISGNHRVQWLLVGVQVALAVVLLAGAGLLGRSLRALGQVSPGFAADHVLTFHVSASWGETSDRKGLVQRINRTLDVLGSLSGVEATATAASLPGVPASFPAELQVSGVPLSRDHKIQAELRVVSGSYFTTMRIPLLSGEACRDAEEQSIVMVNRSFVQTYLDGVNPLGRELQMVANAFAKPGRIVAVVGDARETGLHREPVPTVYWCYSASLPDPYYLVRTAVAPQAMAETVRRKMRELEPGRAVFALQPLEAHLDHAFAENRLRTLLLAFFAGTAVLLACVGLYGTLSYLVRVRQREVGVRLALGAKRSQIVGQFFRQGMGITILGCAAGVALAVASGRLLAGMLFSVSATDAPTLGGVTALVAGVAALACLMPSLRAARLDPMRVLRDE